MSDVEVVVRFADDLLEIVRVPAGSVYTIGTTSVVATPGTEVTIGHVTVSIERAAAPAAVPRKRVEAKPYLFGAGSLAAHIGLVAVALALAPSEPVSVPVIEPVTQQRGGVRIKNFVTAAQTVTREPSPAEIDTPPDTSHDDRVDRDTPAPAMSREFAPSEITGGGLADGPKDGDGTSQRFDPSANPAFDTIKSGAYSTVSTGRGAGDQYAPEARNSSLVVITCDRMSCLVIGGEKATRIRKAVEERTAELTDCYKRAAESGGGSVEIDFGVDTAGTVKDVDVGQVDPAGLCVAKIIRSLKIDDDQQG